MSAAGLPSGSSVGPFLVTRLLGAGAMGEVYLAHDPRLGRDVALKFLAQGLVADEESRARFARETQAVARLDHPNIVALHEIGEHDGRPYLVMQYVDGPSLAEFSRGRRLTQGTALDLGAQLCAGLQAAHEQGIVHRDVKPSNVLIDSRLRARLVDFGLARIERQPRLTATGSLCGTIGYCPPESLLGEEADEQGDLFSLGVVLFELLTGELPFTATSVGAYGYAVLHEPPRFSALDREGLPAGLEPVLQKALARDRASRYRTAAEFGADLKNLVLTPERQTARARRRPSIAVLPFQVMSPGRDQEYLCDGIAEELINGLARVEGLRVIARTSAFTFRGSRAGAQEIGRSLGVGVLLEGSVRTAGRRVRISARLIAVKDGSQLWAENFDRELDDIFAIQDEVCLGVAERLRVTLLEEERARVVRRSTRDADAYALYLKARFLFHQRSVPSARRSVEYFGEAIESDPRFALAHAGLAEAYEALGSWRALPPEVAFAEARKSALAAVDLDERLPEGHVALATIRMFCDWDWSGARREFERALALDPVCVDAHHMYAHWHETMGDFDRALAEMDRALELEPVAPDLHSCLAEILFYARRYDEVVRQSGVTLEMAPGFAGTYGWLGMAHVLAGRAKVGLEELRRGLEQRPGDPRLEALLGAAQALAGNEPEARACDERLGAWAGAKYVDPYFRAWPLSVLGDVDAACRWLERAREEHSMWVHLAGVDPLLDGLRSDPRFAKLVARMGLPA